jgi:hypothetical protein
LATHPSKIERHRVRCPEREEGYGQTDEARRKDYPPRENAGGEANGAYGVVPVHEKTGD